MSKNKKFAVYINSGSTSLLYGVYPDSITAVTVALNIFRASTCKNDVQVYDESESAQGIKILDMFRYETE